jgi:glycosyltransferase involved in cell wall biosynthesis
LLLLLHVNQLESARKILMEEQTNIAYLIERLQAPMPDVFIVIASSNADAADCRIAADILSKLGKKVFLLKLPVECPIDHDVDMKDTLSVSLDNVEEHASLTVIYPAALVQDGKWLGDNRDYIISYILDHLSENHLATVLGSGDMFDRLERSKLLQKKFQRLSHFKSDYLNRNMAFGWAGDYLSCISQIYGFDARAELSEPANCDFSIVIPTRNTANTLRSTLQTCLKQRFTGSYEVILSDNSEPGYTEVYELWQELNDKRIKYFRTPRELPLTKSFEFAFLKARGSFIFSIGADDAVFPWTLEVLHTALNHLPDDEIVAWDRGTYIWPDAAKIERDKLVVPGHYRKNDITIARISGKEALNQVMHESSIMYSLPLLYINSGFRRSYFQTLLDNTGCLWNGSSQDIYMGIVSISINDSFPVIKYPLTIAGISSASIGRMAHRVITESAEMTKFQNLQSRNLRSKILMHSYMSFSIERLLPKYTSDKCLVYSNLLRTVALGVQSPDLLENFDWKKIIGLLVEFLSIEDVLIEQKLNLLRYSASLIDADIAEYVEKEICTRYFSPRLIEKSPGDEKKGYPEGFVDGGGLILDASKFGVSNIYEAVGLFEKIVNL